MCVDGAVLLTLGNKDGKGTYLRLFYRSPFVMQLQTALFSICLISVKSPAYKKSDEEQEII